MRVARTPKVKVISNKEQLGLFSLKEGSQGRRAAFEPVKGGMCGRHEDAGSAGVPRCSWNPGNTTRSTAGSEQPTAVPDKAHEGCPVGSKEKEEDTQWASVIPRVRASLTCQPRRC